MNFEFDERLERASTLPSRLYFDRTTFEAEKRAIFYRTWQMVGRLEQLPEEGSYFTCDVVDEPLIIARDQRGELRGFHNVCRHRAGPVAEGAGCRSSLQCRYHGWTYSLDGKLIGTPEFDGVECFSREENGLRPVKVEAWEQFIFVSLDESAPPLAQLLEDIPRMTHEFEVSRMKFVERRDYVIDCNWKVYVDNYLEGYHIPIVHPGLMRELDYTKYRTITRRYFSLQDAPIKQGGAYYGSREQRDALYFWVFPNLMVNINPETLSTNLIVPLSESKTLTIFEWFAHAERLSEARESVQATIDFSEEIQQEDIKICERVQRGLRSITYDRGRYSVRRENGVHHFHSLWMEFMRENEPLENTEE